MSELKNYNNINNTSTLTYYHLLCARHWAKQFICVILFNAYCNPHLKKGNWGMKRQFGLLVHSKEVAEMKFQIRLACWSLELDSTILSHCLPPSLEVAVKAFCERPPAYLSVISLTLHTPLELNYPLFPKHCHAWFLTLPCLCWCYFLCLVHLPCLSRPKFQLILQCVGITVHWSSTNSSLSSLSFHLEEQVQWFLHGHVPGLVKGLHSNVLWQFFENYKVLHKRVQGKPVFLR